MNGNEEEEIEEIADVFFEPSGNRGRFNIVAKGEKGSKKIIRGDVKTPQLVAVYMELHKGLIGEPFPDWLKNR